MGKSKSDTPKVPDYRSARFVPVLLVALALVVAFTLAPTEGLVLLGGPGVVLVLSALVAQMFIRRGEKKAMSYVAAANARAAAQAQPIPPG